MSLQEYVERQIKAARAIEFATSDHLNLGQIIEKCEAIPLRDGEDEQIVVFDFEYASPTKFASWRGVYADLALGFEVEGGEPLLSDFIRNAKTAVGKTFEGYKGGEFTMTRDTPVWVANYGNAGSTAIVGVYDEGFQVVLLTAYRPT